MRPQGSFVFAALVIALGLVSRVEAAGPSLLVGHDADAAEAKSEGEAGETGEAREEKTILSIRGLVFGDFYGVPSHHLEEADGDISTWVRRVYTTFDAKLNDRLFARLRFEANQAGDFADRDFSADFKDVFLRWSLGRHDVFLGLQPTATIDFADQLWGYRHLEKTPLDLQGVPSRDTGVGVQGPLTKSGRWSYRVMVGSGNTWGKETGEGDKLQAALHFGGDEGWLVDLYGDHQRLPGATDRTTFQVIAGYRRPGARLILQYAYQDREEDPRLEVVSTYGVVDVTRSISLIGRVDRLLAPSPNGNDIDYLPFDPSAKATLLIGAAEFRFGRTVSLMPNVEAILYDDPSDAPKPKDDILVRLTFYIHL